TRELQVKQVTTRSKRIRLDEGDNVNVPMDNNLLVDDNSATELDLLRDALRSIGIIAPKRRSRTTLLELYPKNK
ncbi:unnamed protein product, partial [Didymodactylos carnosus]